MACQMKGWMYVLISAIANAFERSTTAGTKLCGVTPTESGTKKHISNYHILGNNYYRLGWP
jgi:hypothetical protein